MDKEVALSSQLTIPNLKHLSKRLLPIALCLVFIFVLIMPMILHNDIVKTIEISTDMQHRLDIIRGIANSTDYFWLYYGEVLVSYLFYPLANNVYLGDIYLWFSFAVLICAGFVLYYVIKKLVDRNSALLAVGLAVFGSTGILALFKYGVIFNIINMYIILPLAILFAIRWRIDERKRDLFISLCLFALFSIFHSTALYLPYVGIVAVVCTIYPIIRKNWRIVKRAILLSLGVIGLNLILSQFFVHVGAAVEWNHTISINRAVEAVLNPSGAIQAVLARLSLVVMNTSIPILVLFLCAIVGLVIKRKSVVCDKKFALFLLALGCFIVVLFVGICLASISDYNRLSLDLATLLALATSILLNKLMSIKEVKVFNPIIWVIIAFAVIPTLISVVTTG